MKKPKKPTVNDTIGKPLQRDEEYTKRVFIRALSEEIKKDVVVEFGDWYELSRKFYPDTGGLETPNKSKIKAYCPIVDSYLQFPRHLRVPGTRCICDISSTTADKVGGFWRYIKGTVRAEGSDKILA